MFKIVSGHHHNIYVSYRMTDFLMSNTIYIIYPICLFVVLVLVRTIAKSTCYRDRIVQMTLAYINIVLLNVRCEQYFSYIHDGNKFTITQTKGGTVIVIRMYLLNARREERYNGLGRTILTCNVPLPATRNTLQFISCCIMARFRGSKGECTCCSIIRPFVLCNQMLGTNYQVLVAERLLIPNEMTTR